MRLTQLRRPIVAASSAISRSTTIPAIRQVQDVFAQLNLNNIDGRRHASVKSQGAYKLRDSSTIPKKLGAKKSGDSYVITGNIIYKQRGTKWHPGENVGIGRDHTIYALVSGYVKYYRDPKRHPKRQYIGVVFDKNDKLPYEANAIRKRKLNMVASPIPPPAPLPELSASGIPNVVVRPGPGKSSHPRNERVMKLADDGSYAYKEENWRLGTLVRTKKHKMGSRRVAMRHRRIKAKAIGLEMRAAREDKIARRKEGLEQRRTAKMRQLAEYWKRQKAERAKQAAAGGAKSGGVPPPPPPPASSPPPPRAEA
ncbi:ribosomal L27 protein-domain-containing protein [Xylariaceae sp. FL0255]|nr:ribosomal L27 protein-domain-containing protein [Xylariaceae sp. FL0255]